MSYQNNLSLELEKGDRIAIEEDTSTMVYEFVNKTDTARLHFGLLDNGLNTSAMEGDRVIIGEGTFNNKIRDANSVTIEFRESEDLETSQRKG